MDVPSLWINDHCLKRYSTLPMIVNDTPVILPKKARTGSLGVSWFSGLSDTKRIGFVQPGPCQYLLTDYTKKARPHPK